jgi:hypothetical protein
MQEMCVNFEKCRLNRIAGGAWSNACIGLRAPSEVFEDRAITSKSDMRQAGLTSARGNLVIIGARVSESAGKGIRVTRF